MGLENLYTVLDWFGSLGAKLGLSGTGVILVAAGITILIILGLGLLIWFGAKIAKNIVYLTPKQFLGFLAFLGLILVFIGLIAP